MSDKIFTAKWIAPENCTNLPVLRKSFNIDNSFEKAEIFISGLGIFFEMHINGRKAHDTYFEPGESVYEKVELKPCFPDNINSFSLKMKTPKGQINIRWERKDKIIFECEHSKEIGVAYTI